MTRRIDILNGPNLNRLGTREPQIYGTTTLAQVEAMCRAAAPGYAITFRQSNAESQIIDWIHEAIDAPADAIVINPAGLTFTSVPVMDALKMFGGPIVELHISNIHRRESIYHESHAAQAYSSEPCTQMNDWTSIWSRGFRSRRSARTRAPNASRLR
jgi:3-dehydroquinate dehydratase-2